MICERELPGLEILELKLTIIPVSNQLRGFFHLLEVQFSFAEKRFL